MGKKIKIGKYISSSLKKNIFNNIKYIAKNKTKTDNIIIQKKLINFSYRFFKSLIPFNLNFYKIIDDSPDIYGPFLIYTIISFIILGLDAKLVFPNKKEIIINRYLPNCFKYLANFYICGFGMPFLNMIILNIFNNNKVKYIYVLCIYGYSFSPFIPITSLIFFRFNSFFILSLQIFGLYSCLLFLITNLCRKLKKYQKYEKLNVVEVVFLALSLVIFCYLFKNSSVVKFFNFNYNDILSKNEACRKNNNKIIIINTNIKQRYIISKDKNSIKNKKMGCFGNECNIVKIGIAADNNRIYPALVFLTSLMEHIDLKTKYEIYVISNQQIQFKLKEILNTLLDIYGENQLDIIYLLINEKDFNSFLTNKFITKTAYFRIKFPSLLPDYDKILYLDVDIINFDDLSNLYNISLQNNDYIGASINYVRYVKEITRFKIPAKIEVNSGILLMNLKSFRQ